MNINLLNIVSIIFIALALLSGPLLQVIVQDQTYSFPIYSIPNTISGSADFLFNLLHLVLTIMLYFSIIILAIYSFLNKKSSFAATVLGIITGYIIVSSILFAIASSVSPDYSFVISPYIIYLLIAFMLTRTSDIYAVYLVSPDGNRVPLTIASLRNMLRTSSRQATSPKPVGSGETSPKQKESEKEKEEKEEKKEEKKKKKRKEEKKSSEEKVLSEIAKEILRG